MKTPDPFNHGSTETLNSHPVADESDRAVVAIMARFRGDPEGRALMLDVFGLTETAELMLHKRRRELRLIIPMSTSRPSPQEAPAGVLVALTDPRGRRLRPQQRAAIAKAQCVLAEAATEEVPPVAGIVRCGRRLHYRTAVNTEVRSNGSKHCRDCAVVLDARSILRNYGLLT